MAILRFNEKIINYQLIRRQGMKTIRIKISADGGIVVSTNPLVSEKKIEDFLLSRIDWIMANSKKYTERYRETVEFSFTHGDKLNIFGAPYTLFLKTGECEHIQAENGIINITVTDLSNQAHIELMIFGFTSDLGRRVIDEIYNRLCKRVGLSEEKRPKIVLKVLKSKWGHNNRRKNEIMLNLAMCGLPYELIEYIIAHEIAHCFVPNHSAAFYNFGAAYFSTNFKQLDRALNHYDTDIRLTIKKPQNAVNTR